MLYYIYMGKLYGRTWSFNYKEDKETQVYISILRDRDDITKAIINIGDYVYVNVEGAVFRKLVEFG